MSPHPPFDIVAVSDELPLVFNQTYKQRTAYIAFVCGFDVSSSSGDSVSEPAGAAVRITYGAADIEARMLTLTLPEFEALFTGQVAFREVTVPWPADPPKPHVHV